MTVKSYRDMNWQGNGLSPAISCGATFPPGNRGQRSMATCGRPTSWGVQQSWCLEQQNAASCSKRRAIWWRSYGQMSQPSWCYCKAYMCRSCRCRVDPNIHLGLTSWQSLSTVCFSTCQTHATRSRPGLDQWHTLNSSMQDCLGKGSILAL